MPLGPHPSDAEGHVRVAYPPPPARIEVIPLRRRDACLWLDGYWDARGNEWQWVKGTWVQAAPRCYYARPSTRFESTPAGTALVYQPGAWYLKKGNDQRCEPPPLCGSTSEDPEPSEVESP